MSWASIAVGTASVVAGSVSNSKAKKEAKKLQENRPKYEISPYAKDEVSLAESDFANGLSAEATQAYEEGADRDLSTSLSTLLKSGGGANNIGSLYDSSLKGRLDLAKLREVVRLNKYTNLINSWRNMNEQGDKQFEFNEWQPWADNSQANAEARKGATNQIWSGLGTAASGIASAYNQNQWDKRYDDYLNPPQGTSPSMRPTELTTSVETIRPQYARPSVLQPRTSPNVGMDNTQYNNQIPSGNFYNLSWRR